MFRTSIAPGTPSQRAASEETRRHILDTALGLFREKGFEETTMRDIASRADVSLGAAYYYFESKEAIVGAYYESVQHSHQLLARETFARGGDLRARLRVALHAKIDIMQEDRRFLRALFRYGGDPDHPLSWFGKATREQRQLSTNVFAEVIEKERLPDDVRDAAPTILWALHMGILLYFLYDASPQQRRTRRLIDASTDFVVYARRIVTSPFLRPVRRRVLDILRDAGLLAPAGSAAER
jgi:AcrR family transcriptional regulator